MLPFKQISLCGTGLKGGVSLFNLCCFTNTVSSTLRLDVVVCRFLSAYSFIFSLAALSFC